MSTRRDFLTQTAAAGILGMATSPLLKAQAPAMRPGSVMKTYRIPNTKLEVSRLGFGCAMLGIDWNAADFVERSTPLMETAYEQGITFFDTADVYGHGKSELALAELFSRRPDIGRKAIVQSKCGDRAFKDGMTADNSREHIITSVEGSLRRLGRDRLDILLLHWPDSLVEPDEVADAFERLHRSGKVRYFGVSNHSPWQIEILKKSVRQPLVANQIQLGLGYWYTSSDNGKALFMHGFEGVPTLDYCRAKGIQVQAYSPLRATHSLSANATPNLLRPSDSDPPQVKRVTDLLADIAKKYEVTPAAIMLAWLLRHPAQIMPIIGAIKKEHIVDNCKADQVELSREEWWSLLRAAGLMKLPQNA